MIRALKEDPSLVAGLQDGTCVAACAGDFNLDSDGMTEVCDTVMAYIHDENWGAYGDRNHIAYALQSSWGNRDWIVTFSGRG